MRFWLAAEASSDLRGFLAPGAPGGDKDFLQAFSSALAFFSASALACLPRLTLSASAFFLQSASASCRAASSLRANAVTRLSLNRGFSLFFSSEWVETGVWATKIERVLVTVLEYAALELSQSV